MPLSYWAYKRDLIQEILKLSPNLKFKDFSDSSIDALLQIKGKLKSSVEMEDIRLEIQELSRENTLWNIRN